MQHNIHSDLTNGTIFPENIVDFLCCDFVWKISDVENSVNLWW